MTAPSHVAERVALLQETQLSCVPGFIQKAGIEASMMDWGITTADMNTYTAANAGATIADIAYEKYMAL